MAFCLCGGGRRRSYDFLDGFIRPAGPVERGPACHVPALDLGPQLAPGDPGWGLVLTGTPDTSNELFWLHETPYAYQENPPRRPRIGEKEVLGAPLRE